MRGIFQARILEWVAISYSRESSLTQGSNLRLLVFLHWQADSLPLNHLESSGYSGSSTGKEILGLTLKDYIFLGQITKGLQKDLLVIKAIISMYRKRHEKWKSLSPKKSIEQEMI